MPNFFIVGAARSGTTSLWNYLREHPQVFMSPIKHTRFFALENEAFSYQGPPPRDPRKRNNSESVTIAQGVRDIESYRKLFEGSTSERAVGEASHSYLYSREAAGRIKSRVPEARIVAIIRNPVERAFSHYCHLRQMNREPLASFSEALGAESERVRENWWPDYYYARLGLYGEQLERYFETFRPEQIRIYLYEDFISDPKLILTDLFTFLGVNEGYLPDVKVRYNTSGIAKSKLMHEALLKLSLARPYAESVLPKELSGKIVRSASRLKSRNLKKPEVSTDAKNHLLEFYREDIAKTEGLIGRNLSSWLE